MNKIILTNEDCAHAAKLVCDKLAPLSDSARHWNIYGIPRGGISAAYLIAANMTVPHTIVDSPEDANLIVDDLIDSGATIMRYMTMYPKAIFASLFDKTTSHDPLPRAYVSGLDKDAWLVFPWEREETGHDMSATDTVVRMMQAIGEDVTREGLQETPKRVVKAWGEWFKGYHMNAADLMKTFEDGAEKSDEMVLLTEIPVFSHCEHHITPFIGVAHVAYIPNGKIVGLSKIAKVVDMFSRRLQVQERLTNQIADCIQEHLDPLGVAVVIKAKHFCMATRGVRTPNVDTTTSAIRGVFKEKPETRAEFFSLLPRD